MIITGIMTGGIGLFAPPSSVALPVGIGCLAAGAVLTVLGFLLRTRKMRKKDPEAANDGTRGIRESKGISFPGLFWTMAASIVVMAAGEGIIVYALAGFSDGGSWITPGKQFVKIAQQGVKYTGGLWFLLGFIVVILGAVAFIIAQQIRADKLYYTAHPGLKTRRLGFFRKVMVNRQFLLLMLPGILFTLVFAYLPMPGVIIAFKRLSLTMPNFVYNLLNSPWCGFYNIITFFKSNMFWIITRNTIGYNLIFIFFGLVGNVALAIALTELRQRKAGLVYQTVFIFPAFISWVIVSFLIYAFLNPEVGMVNTMLKSVGIAPISWYTQPKYWPYLLVFFNMWKG
ncbi:MAG: hypothetical protein FWF44_09355, partial [Defluviitaleaceae bacterium]|nr:hypothetical protein [Defluviitaleaceae bacterium]